jgi:ATP-dependent RNA helicase RhlE
MYNKTNSGNRNNGSSAPRSFGSRSNSSSATPSRSSGGRPGAGRTSGASSFGNRSASAGSYGSRPFAGRTNSASQGQRSDTYISRPFAGKSATPRSGGFGGSSRGGNSRPQSGRGGFGGGRPRFGGKARGSKGPRLDISRFINKAVITEEVDVFIPEHSFEDFKIEDVLKANVVKKGFKNPSPIQDKIIPHILRGEDVVGIANTGTGKTAAFLLPLINKAIQNPDEQVLIMAPTRELAIQIDEELKTFIKGLKIFSVCCVGGAYIGKQISELRYFNNFIIGTPGRLKDLIERRSLNLSKCKNLVLDEADRMLDMGFINDMKYVMGLMPKDRQTLFFSATLGPEIERIINDFLKSPIRISVKTQDTAKSIDQDVVRVKGGQKLDMLHDLLIQPEFNKVLIFGRTKHGVEKLTNMLADRGFKAVSIHGDKAHAQRQRALKLFKDNTVQMLVATDVAARGLDIPNVSHVINYDLPETYEDYVHRIGRTGRADKTGKALTFVE